MLVGRGSPGPPSHHNDRVGGSCGDASCAAVAVNLPQHRALHRFGLENNGIPNGCLGPYSTLDYPECYESSLQPRTHLVLPAGSLDFHLYSRSIHGKTPVFGSSVPVFGVEKKNSGITYFRYFLR